MAVLTPESTTNAGTAAYIPAVLSVYDFFVLSFSNTYAWLCPTSTVLLPLFRSSLGQRHLDVGVGTGYFPEQTLKGSACREITLMDLNENTLKTAEGRIKAVVGDAVEVKGVKADVLAPPLPLSSGTKYDSISLFYLLHCLPGPPPRKSAIFSSLAPHLASGGQIVGATVLGAEREMNVTARMLMGLYNWLGVFGNWEDGEKVFTEALEKEFDDVEAWVQGRVFLFRARGR